ncbi:MAG: cell division protein ZipA [Gammaproteobacteria bacterium]|nr:cell division protein ZipA [Gammaproteobacteria bacterium]
MTAGERIGVRAGQAKPKGQSSLFGEDEIAAAKPDQSRSKALFAAFSRKTAAVEAPKPVVTTKLAQSPPQPPPISVNVAPKPQIATRPQVIPNQQVIIAKPKQSRIAPVQESNQVKQVKDVVAEPAHERATAEPSSVIVINVMAKAGLVFVGDDLLHVLITSGMKFGDMNIFHRRLGGDNKSPVIFSIANILNPGTFDLNKMHDFSTLGVSLFLALPTSIKNLDAFDQMLNVARQLCGALEGELRDDSRNLMTAQTIEHYRQRIRDFELRRLKAVGTRG